MQLMHCIIHCHERNGREMTRTVLITLCVIFITIHCTAQLSCGPGEEEDSCPTECWSDKCPTKENQYRFCSVSNNCGAPKCKCHFNTRRAVNGTCIDVSKCPPFKCDRPNEEYVACPPFCPTDDCKQATLDGRCPIFGMFMIVECDPACRCIKGYWRKNGKCVPYDECPQHAEILPIFFGKL